jgi:DNA-binding NarL/FixJ family response regulator
MTKIAIVEDNKTIRESLAEFVQNDPENRCVCTCATAEEALKVIPTHQPDIVLMDIQLPNLSGIECCAQLKQLLPSAQIIMVTVYEDTERIFKALRAGACGYLLKRCTPEELISAIREVKHARSYFLSRNRSPPPLRWKTFRRANGRFWNCWPKGFRTSRSPAGWA